MYVSYLLDKEGNMYSNSVRHPALNLNPQNFAPPPPPPPPPQYSDFAGYHHHVPGIGPDPHHTQPATTWGSPYVPPREEWHGYGNAAPTGSSSGSQLPFGPTDFSSMQPQGAGGLLPSMNTVVPQLSPGSPKRNPYDWMRRNIQQNPQGKTRTKDKYRVVYTDHQRLELEKEFHYSRYITIRRKSELALSLGLSERQVKIWFQNRRAKERKINKKKLQQQSQQASSTTPSPRALPAVGLVSSSSNLIPQPLPLNIKEEYLS
ncbi:homeobox protein CDX-1b [Pristis pectinata]|uniref:homeobox protein CDX-1b n=1 Tax=Pristis pectinata TaxID=685728 RepID=UPI00223CA19E|nr:homeobox protein CDX-1b [Pristis pectinata]